MTYQGAAFHPKYSGGKKSGELSFTSNSLIFKNDTDTVAFDLNTIELESGGASNALIYFKHLSHPDWLIYTSDRSILKNEVLRSFEHTRKFAHSARTNRGLLNAFVLFIFGLPLIAVAILFVFRSSLVKYIANKVPVHYEQELGNKMFPLATEGKRMIQDSTLLLQLQKVVVPLQRSVNDTNFKFTFYIVEDPELNAFALPGGHVVIHSGLIQNSDSYEELAGVLAHELSHVTLRHHIRGLVNNVGMMVLLGVFIGGDDSFYSTIIYGGAQLTLLKYGRDMESESDSQGFDYLMNAKIDPKGMVSFFKKLHEKYDKLKESEELETAMSFISTHPATQDRIESLEKMLGKTDINSCKPIEGDFAAFKKMMSEKLETK